MSKEAARAVRRVRMVARGRRSFILRYGVFFWGVSTAIAFSLYQGFTLGWGSFLYWVSISLVIFPIGGWFWGVAMWRFAVRAQLDAGDSESPDQNAG